jgi:GNAT superfamily N-acetyltransferase
MAKAIVPSGPAAPPSLSFRPVDPAAWPDFERLFETRGAPKYCWCMAWRATPEEAHRRDGPSRKKAMRKRVRAGLPVGVLAYCDGQPAAWCSVAPRSTYRRLGGPEEGPGENIWSLVCFFVARPWRGRGIVRLLIREAEAYARRGGATILEAYPVQQASPSYRFMGKVQWFRKAGYRQAGRAGSRRHVMRKVLDG